MTITTEHRAGGVRTAPEDIYRLLADLDSPCHVVRTPDGIGLTEAEPAQPPLASAGPLPPERLGAPKYLAAHDTRYAYHGGAMAGGIASEEMVLALRQAGFQASFGAAGLSPQRVEAGLRRLSGTQFACNLIHSPHEPDMEEKVVDLCLRHGVRCVEASAFMELTPSVVRYRATGLGRDTGGAVTTRHRVIAKVSRPEVAEHFLRPAPGAMVDRLLERGALTAEQAELACQVPVADDITVEADSGGHTDNQVLSAVFPSVLRQRDVMPRVPGLAPVRVGAAGGLGTPEAVSSAFGLGADYVVTGSVNQSCVEAGTSRQAREMLARTGLSDCRMAPAADMFEMGVQLQVLGRGTMFPMRSRRLYEIYRAYDGLEQIPAQEREQLENRLFLRPLEEVWSECVAYFSERDPAQLERAERDPKHRMALVFRWYLAMGSRWATTGEQNRQADYQIWCGPAMGAFNDWARGTYLAAAEHRHVAEVATHLMRGAAFTARVWQLRLAGVRLPASCATYRPEPLR